MSFSAMKSDRKIRRQKKQIRFCFNYCLVCSMLLERYELISTACSFFICEEVRCTIYEMWDWQLICQRFDWLWQLIFSLGKSFEINGNFTEKFLIKFSTCQLENPHSSIEIRIACFVCEWNIKKCLERYAAKWPLFVKDVLHCLICKHSTIAIFASDGVYHMYLLQAKINTYCTRIAKVKGFIRI